MGHIGLVLRHPALRRLHGLWLGLAAPSGRPVAADIDPALLRPWVGHLVLVDVGPGPSYRYSFYGDHLAAAFGQDRVGHTLAHLPEQQGAVLSAEYAKVCRERSPAARLYTSAFEGESQTWERLVLPLFDGADGVEKLLVGAYRMTPASTPSHAR